MAEKKYLNLEGLTDVAGHVNTRLKTVTTIPVSADNGAVRLYVGNTDSTYTKGHIYQYQLSNTSWIDITDFYDKTEIGALSDLPDTTKNVIENISQIKLSVDQLSASKLSISDIDNTLSDVSENPVQNKVIKLSIDDLAGSILTKADKVSGATNNDFATLDNNGNLTDSGISKDIVPNTATTSNKLATANDIPDELSDLTDVEVTSPTNGQILVYNSTSHKFENQTGSAPIGGATFQGSILYANLPTTGMNNGDWYDIKDAFTTDNRFEEGSGIDCAAGTDVIWVANDNKWNILTPSGVYSFNGRLGAVVPASGDYSASDVGLGNVINTGDSATPVSGGTTKFTTGGAYTELNKKADKVSSATNGNFAGLDANGNLTDSGKKASDFAGTGVVSTSTNGLAPKVTNTLNYLKGDGTWSTPTDTKNTAGSTDTSSKIYLVGATEQSANPQTYSDNEVFAQNGQLNSKKVVSKVFNELQTGTGTAGSQSGSIYYPAKWTFNFGFAISDGDIITIKIPVAGYVKGIWLSVDNGVNYYPVATIGTARLTDSFGVDTYISLVFEATGSCSIYALNGSTESSVVTGGVFRVINYYDSGNTTYNVVSTSANGLAPKITDTLKYLKGDGTWALPSKSDVGLSDVPNVSTNDQTPTFSQASSRTNIASGEKLSVIFGKIMKWFADIKDLAFISKDSSSTTYLRGDGVWQSPKTYPAKDSTVLIDAGGVFSTITHYVKRTNITASAGDTITFPITGTTSLITATSMVIPVCNNADHAIKYTEIKTYAGYATIKLAEAISSAEIGLIIVPSNVSET